MKALSGILVVALAACSTPSEVVKTGPNAYRVRTDAGGGKPSDAEIKTRGIARANEFCDAQGKRAVINVGQSSRLASVQHARPPKCSSSATTSCRAGDRSSKRRAGLATAGASAASVGTRSTRPRRGRRRAAGATRVAGDGEAAGGGVAKIARPFD